MVTVGESYDKLSLVMDEPIDSDVVLLLQLLWRNEIGLVSQELIAILRIVWPDS